MNERNRSTGWQHAKISGHVNEESIASLIASDLQVQKRILTCSHLENETIESVSSGGIYEVNVSSVLGNKTKSKTDIRVLLSNKKVINVSLKKSPGGQVYLIGVDRFISGFEKQYNRTIPENVKKAISLFWGTSIETKNIINTTSTDYKKYETKKHRIVASTLSKLNKNYHSDLLIWFGENIEEVFDFCFSRGLARNIEDWAHIVWYKNQLNENSIDIMFNIKDTSKALPQSSEYGRKGGGTTIQLPFGFVQWHSPRKIVPGEMQFHHSFEKLLSLSNEKY